MPPEFECRREVVLAATPEEVWEAVATSEGNAAWLFPTPADPSAAQVWEPPHHLAVRQEQGDWYNALEFVIEECEGGTSLLRYVHTGIFVDNWDTQYDAVQQHTDFYLHTLSEYLKHFKGRAATYIGDVPQGILGPPSSATPEGFKRLIRALGLDEKVSENDHARMTPDGLDPVDGVVDDRRPNFMGVRSAESLYCFFGRNAFGSPVGMTIHSFDNGIDADAVKEGWQRWLFTALA